MWRESIPLVKTSTSRKGKSNRSEINSANVKVWALSFIY